MEAGKARSRITGLWSTLKELLLWCVSVDNMMVITSMAMATLWEWYYIADPFKLVQSSPRARDKLESPVN